MAIDVQVSAVGQSARHLYVYNSGLIFNKRVRRILSLSGYDVKLGKPNDGDMIGVWGKSPTSSRGEAVAARTNIPILRIEDAFLRSVLTGREGDDSIGLHLDTRGVHFDPAQASDLEIILRKDRLDDPALLRRAREGIETLRRNHLSKYNAYDPAASCLDADYVVVIDQAKGDASVTASGADSSTFKEMLLYAQTEHPLSRIVIKTHPETQAGHRVGYYGNADTSNRISLLETPISPYTLFDGAIAVYTVSSQMGFEAILTGHKPVVFGQPFYTGWGLTHDRKPLDRRQRNLTSNQLFAGAMLLYPKWYDPFRDQLCSFETTTANLAASTRAWRDDHAGWDAHGINMWKRKPLQKFFGQHARVAFTDALGTRQQMVWAGKVTHAQRKHGVTQVEDGFLRSRGLGADLTAPLSLVLDELGIYYDPSCTSRLEVLIEASVHLQGAELERAKHLLEAIIFNSLSKYNLSASVPDQVPKGRCILVPGQVEDDASIRLGAGDVKTNKGLLETTRTANPTAIIIYKPHPDVESGLRDGHIANATAFADVVATNTDPIRLLDKVDEVWTMTSLLGFEALLRSKSVTCLGTPFYAGWGLTHDRAVPVARRIARPSLAQLVHAVLIDYPRYHDPKTNLPCPVEVIVNRLATGDIPRPGPFNRTTAKLQGFFASYAYLWRN